MTPTVITGLTGAIELPNDIVQRFSALRLNGGQELVEISAYGGNKYRTRLPLLADLSGQTVAFVTKGLAQNPGIGVIQTDPGAMTITFDTGCSVGFNAYVGSFQIVGEYRGLNIITHDFAKGDDALPTVAWVDE